MFRLQRLIERHGGQFRLRQFSMGGSFTLTYEKVIDGQPFSEHIALRGTPAEREEQLQLALDHLEAILQMRPAA